jgi:Rrf2 family protein
LINESNSYIIDPVKPARRDILAYSTEFSRAISIALYVNLKMEEFGYEYVSTRMIAEHLKIPAPTVVRILKSLNDAGITTAKEGSKGGVLLSAPMTKITLLDIFLAIEPGHLFKTEINFMLENPRVDVLRTIVTNCLQDAEDAMKKSLAQTTLTDIAAGGVVVPN